MRNETDERPRSSESALEILRRFFLGLGRSNASVVTAFKYILERLETDEGKAYLIYLITLAIGGIPSSDTFTFFPEDSVLTNVHIIDYDQQKAGEAYLIIKFDYKKLSDSSVGSVCIKLTGTFAVVKSSVVECNKQEKKKQVQQQTVMISKEEAETEQSDEEDLFSL